MTEAKKLGICSKCLDFKEVIENVCEECRKNEAD